MLWCFKGNFYVLKRYPIALIVTMNQKGYSGFRNRCCSGAFLRIQHCPRSLRIRYYSRNICIAMTGAVSPVSFNPAVLTWKLKHWRTLDQFWIHWISDVFTTSCVLLQYSTFLHISPSSTNKTCQIMSRKLPSNSQIFADVVVHDFDKSNHYLLQQKRN